LNINDLLYSELQIKIRETSSLSDHLEMKMRGIEQQLSSFIDLMFHWFLLNKLSNSEGGENDRGKEGGG